MEMQGLHPVQLYPTSLWGGRGVTHPFDVPLLDKFMSNFLVGKEVDIFKQLANKFFNGSLKKAVSGCPLICSFGISRKNMRISPIRNYVIPSKIGRTVYLLGSLYFDLISVRYSWPLDHDPKCIKYLTCPLDIVL